MSARFLAKVSITSSGKVRLIASNGTKSNIGPCLQTCWDPKQAGYALKQCSVLIRRNLWNRRLRPQWLLFNRLSLTHVLVMAAPPYARLVAPLGCAVEPLVHPPEAVHSARIGGVSVVDDAVF